MPSPPARDALPDADLRALRACAAGDRWCGYPRDGASDVRASLWDRRLIRACRPNPSWHEGYEITPAGLDAIQCGSCGGTGEFPVQTDIATYVDCGACS